MAVRMNVLVLRPAGHGSKAHQQFDDVIGQLLGRPGLDVTLLERLPNPEDSTTERLALESLGGHIACLAWADANAIVNELTNAGKPMSRRPHRGDPDVANVNGTPAGGGHGRMFFFDMRRAGANVSIFEDLQELLRTLQTPTFHIGSVTTPPRIDALTPVPKVVSPDSNPTPADDRPELLSAEPTSVPERSVSESETSRQLRQERINEEFDGDLDRLVDQLDELDL